MTYLVEHHLGFNTFLEHYHKVDLSMLILGWSLPMVMLCPKLGKD